MFIQQIINQGSSSTSSRSIQQHVLTSQQGVVHQLPRLQIGDRVHVQFRQGIHVLPCLGRFWEAGAPVVPFSGLVHEVVEHGIVCVEIWQSE